MLELEHSCYKVCQPLEPGNMQQYGVEVNPAAVVTFIVSSQPTAVVTSPGDPVGWH